MRRTLMILTVLVCLAVSTVVALVLAGTKHSGGILPKVYAQDRTAGPVAAHQLGRVLLAADGTAQLIGYFAFIDRISGSVFSGTPGEATAFFTLRSSAFSPQPITNGNITVLLVTGETLNVYLNSSPHGDWNNPDSFSGGQLVATLIRRQPEMVINVGTMSSTAGSLHLTSSHEFVFNGQTVDFKNLFLSDLTWLETATATPLSGPSGFVAALPLAGTVLLSQGGE